MRIATTPISFGALLHTPAGEGVPIRSITQAQDASPIALFVPGNPGRSETWPWIDAAWNHPDADLIGFSGWLGDSPEKPSPSNWLPAGRAKLQEVAAAFCEGSGASARRCLMPHSCHLLSDVAATQRVLAASPNRGIALCPAFLVTSSMLKTTDSHLERIVESLVPKAKFVFACDARIATAHPSNRNFGENREQPPLRARTAFIRSVADDLVEDVPLAPCAPGIGCIDGRLLGALLRRLMTEDCTLVLDNASIHPTLKWLGMND